MGSAYVGQVASHTKCLQPSMQCAELVPLKYGDVIADVVINPCCCPWNGLPIIAFTYMHQPVHLTVVACGYLLLVASAAHQCCQVVATWAPTQYRLTC